MIREIRLKEIKAELLTSERLKGYFTDHAPDIDALRHDKPLRRVVSNHLSDVPEYLVPESLKALMPNYFSGGTHKRRWRAQHVHMPKQEIKMVLESAAAVSVKLKRQEM
ncbi:unnamed protein product [Protopolystoma xenopodis]|uniref:Uncharacterized protein n=1 Tax=Protopolystoma xenopodis TaxID=117903 RepID=A0A448XI51_9PLAT|nr:unnamed protein product [Protopolystoma xenopodis]